MAANNSVLEKDVLLVSLNDLQKGYVLHPSGDHEALSGRPDGASGYAVELRPDEPPGRAVRVLLAVFTDGHTMFLSIGPEKVDLNDVSLRVSRRADGYSKRTLVVERHGREVAAFAYRVGLVETLAERDPYYGDLLDYIETVTRTRRDFLWAVYSWQKTREGQDITNPEVIAAFDEFMRFHEDIPQDPSNKS